MGRISSEFGWCIDVRDLRLPQPGVTCIRMRTSSKAGREGGLTSSARAIAHDLVTERDAVNPEHPHAIEMRRHIPPTESAHGAVDGHMSAMRNIHRFSPMRNPICLA